MALTSTIKATVTAQQTMTVGLIPIKANLAVEKSISLANGTAANQSDLLYQASRQLIATSEDLDLAGVLLDAFGSALTFIEVTGLYIENTNTTPGAVLTVGGAAASGFISPFGAATDKIKVGPGGVLLLSSPVDGYAVTAGTFDKLKVDAGAATITYKLGILGRSA